ncbi:MAG: pyruvate, water dikinase regulatory protein, partial [Paraclostridium sp.]
DLMTPILKEITNKVGEKPKREPGIIRKLDESYFKRVEAIEFAVKYDDGKDPRGILKSDIVLLGISRTSKTPLSMYLANKNIKVANVPLVPEIPIPKEVFEVNPKKIIGLTNSPEKLNQIRQERLKALGLSSNANYAKFDRILQELDYSEQVMKRVGCPVINVSNKAIEETAGIILDIMKENGLKIYRDGDK